MLPAFAPDLQRGSLPVDVLEPETSDLTGPKPQPTQQQQDRSISEARSPSSICFSVLVPDRSEGTLLFADISGFTPLTESLGKRLGQREGAEAITKILDLIYGALCIEIWRRRGSVILFSGDALTCWFEGDKGIRAISSALGCQEAMLTFAGRAANSDIPVSLAIKTSAVRGQVHRLITRAAPGQILVSRGLAGELGGRFETRDLGTLELKGFDGKTPILELGAEIQRWATDTGSGEHLSASRTRTGHALPEMIGPGSLPSAGLCGTATSPTPIWAWGTVPRAVANSSWL